MSTVRLTYAKGPELRYLGHLDLYRLWQRTLRRAGLRLAFTEGYRPRPKLAAGPPLSLGFTGRREVLDVTLQDPPPPAALRAALAPVLPPGMTLHDIRPVTAATPTLSSIAQLEYSARLPVPPHQSVAGLADRAAALLAADRLPITRTRKGREKPFDLRPSLRALHVQPGPAPDEVRVDIAVHFGTTGTANPREILAQFGAWTDATIREAVIERTTLEFGREPSVKLHGHTTTHPYSTNHQDQT